jgi:hypothetical protein
MLRPCVRFGKRETSLRCIVNRRELSNTVIASHRVAMTG